MARGASLSRLVVKARTQRLVRRIRQPPPGVTTAFNVWIKIRSDNTPAEAHAMQFVASHTSIPVPKVYCGFTHKGTSYIVMERLKGRSANFGWLSQSEESKKNILKQLERMIKELRSIPPPKGSKISNVDGGPIFDCRLPSKDLWGPFSSIREFHKALVNPLDLDMDRSKLSSEMSDISELLDFYQKAHYDLVFTHGDLSSLNIMVRGDEVVGIIDWETAGWFPSYWEYTTAKNVNPYNTFWAEEVDHFLQPFPQELHMDRIRFKYFGPY